MTTTAPSRADSAAIELPERTSNRAEATALVERAVGDRTIATLSVDASRLVLSAPSFLDQLVKDALVTKGVRHLVVVSAPPRAQRFLAAAAGRRQVESRLRFESPRP